MGKLDKFLAKPQEVEIAGEKYMLKPFTINELPLLTKMSSKDPTIQANATKEVIKLVLKQIDPDAKDEEINQVRVKFLEEIMNAVSSVNNIDVSDAKKKLLEENEKQNS